MPTNPPEYEASRPGGPEGSSRHRPPAIGFVGWSGVGKTTLIEQVIAELKARVLQRFKEVLQPIPGIGLLVSDLQTPFCVASSSDLDRVSLAQVSDQGYYLFAVRLPINFYPSAKTEIFVYI